MQHIEGVRQTKEDVMENKLSDCVVGLAVYSLIVYILVLVYEAHQWQIETWLRSWYAW